MASINDMHSDSEWSDDGGDAHVDSDDGSFHGDLTDALALPASSSAALQRRPKSNGRDDDDDDEAFIQASLTRANFKATKGGRAAEKASASRGGTGGGSFQSLGLHPALLRALLLRGFTTPTPIQRAALPHILANPARDVVGMARTGSGKTLAYMVPLIQKLAGQHSVKFGARAIVLVPTRELALQVLKVGKDLAKGFLQGASRRSDDHEQGESLRWGLIVGGDGLEDQFSMMASNPDVIIATPGRLLHLAVEMNLSLASVAYIVFDEADRLFELGFSIQLTELLTRLPPNRQTLLFSATLPKSLVDFAKAGLQNPKLIRLDSETKISSELQMAFLSVKPDEKDAALLVLLNDVIQVPKAGELSESSYNNSSSAQHHNKRKRGEGDARKSGRSRELNPHQTIVFAATKHHVEYLSQLLTLAGYLCSHIYGSLDQSARLSQLGAFRSGRTSILVVTDLAARGIDIPILENVINYDFPGGSRAFVHRVGRTARAGRKGWAYSLVTQKELPLLMDLQLFLSRSLITSPLMSSTTLDEPDYCGTLVLGTFPRDRVDAEQEYARESLVNSDSSLTAMMQVKQRAQKMFDKSQCKPGGESFRRAKHLISMGYGIAGSAQEEASIHPIFNSLQSPLSKAALESKNQAQDLEKDRTLLLASLHSFKPNETIFEVGTKRNAPAAQLMRDRRKSLGKLIAKNEAAVMSQRQELEMLGDQSDHDEAEKPWMGTEQTVEEAHDSDLEDVFEIPAKRQRKSITSFQDPNAYLNYEQVDAATEKGYSLKEGMSSFTLDVKRNGFDLGQDDEVNYSRDQLSKPSQTRWDRKTKKFVRVDQQGSDNKKMIRTESGTKLPASFKSGSFEVWKRQQKIRVPRNGDDEIKNQRFQQSQPSSRFRHQAGHGHQSENSSQQRGGKGGFGKSHDGKTKFLGPTHQITRGSHSSSSFGQQAPKTKMNQKGKKIRIRPGQHHRSQPATAHTKNVAGLRSIDEMRKERLQKEKRRIRSNQPGKKRK